MVMDVLLMNLAWRGIRAITETFRFGDDDVRVMVEMHRPKGVYIIEELHGSQPINDSYSKFEDVVDYIEGKYGIHLVLEPTKNWVENIKYADEELKNGKEYWSSVELQ